MSETVAARWEEYNEAGRRSFGLGQFAEAEEFFRAAVREGEQLGADSPHLATSLNSLGQLRLQAKDLAEAERCFSRALAIRQQTYGPESHAIVPSLNNLSALHDAKGETDRAVELLRRSLGISEKALGMSHPEVALGLNNLAKLYFKRRDFAKADRLLLRLLETKRTLGRDHPEVATVLGSLAKLRQAVGKHGPAEQLWRQALAIRERAFAPNDPILATTLENVADCCAAQDGRLADAITLRERAIAIREIATGAAHPSLAAARTKLAELRARPDAPPVKPVQIVPPPTSQEVPLPIFSHEVPTFPAGQPAAPSPNLPWIQVDAEPTGERLAARLELMAMEPPFIASPIAHQAPAQDTPLVPPPIPALAPRVSRELVFTDSLAPEAARPAPRIPDRASARPAAPPPAPPRAPRTPPRGAIAHRPPPRVSTRPEPKPRRSVVALLMKVTAVAALGAGGWYWWAHQVRLADAIVAAKASADALVKAKLPDVSLPVHPAIGAMHAASGATGATTQASAPRHEATNAVARSAVSSPSATSSQSRSAAFADTAARTTSRAASAKPKLAADSLVTPDVDLAVPPAPGSAALDSLTRGIEQSTQAKIDSLQKARGDTKAPIVKKP